MSAPMNGTRDAGARRVALVTGGASGLGQASARRLEADGLRVITVDLDSAADYTVDVSDPGAINELADEVGPVDVLVNSAGIVGSYAVLWETTDEDWNRTLAVNLTGTFNCCRAFIPGMISKGWGRVINFSSIAGKEGNPGQSPYVASKGALSAMTKSLGKELATSGVLVHAIAPGLFDTSMVSGSAPESVAASLAKIPMGRQGRPEEAAELVAWLASDKASFSTGFTHDISGGRATY